MTCFLESIFSALKRNLIMLPCPWKLCVCVCPHVCMHVYEFNSFRNLSPKCCISPNLTDYQLAQTTKLLKRRTRVQLSRFQEMEQNYCSHYPSDFFPGFKHSSCSSSFFFFFCWQLKRVKNILQHFKAYHFDQAINQCECVN